MLGVGRRGVALPALWGYQSEALGKVREQASTPLSFHVSWIYGVDIFKWKNSKGGEKANQ